MTTTVAIPTLETGRLRLHAHSHADWPAYRSVQMSDRAQYMDGQLTEIEAWNAFICEAGSWVIDGYGYWSATEKVSGETVAFVGFANPPHFPEAELGWLTTAKADGKGFAFEAAKAALAWGFGTRLFQTLVSYIDPDNTRSIALAERLGAVRDDSAPKPPDMALVYRHPTPEALA